MGPEFVKRRYTISFVARPRGAPAGAGLGYTVTCEAITEQEAVLALYEEFEHTQVQGIVQN